MSIKGLEMNFNPFNICIKCMIKNMHSLCPKCGATQKPLEVESVPPKTPTPLSAVPVT